jgi:5S rRNA maturation endonuclease (ribonuclease M5)
MEDFKPIVANSYLYIIKGTLNRILFFESDTIINGLLRLHISEPEMADEKLVTTDKFYLYRLLWKGILETLYEKYLPNVKYEFKWTIEITPYTLMLCELSKAHFESTEIELFKSIVKVTDEEIESDFDSITEKVGLQNIGLEGGIVDRIPSEFLPATKKEQLILLFRLMNFPPLGELALFQNYYNANLKQQTEQLSIAFTGIKSEKIPDFGMPETLHRSYFHLDHATFKKYGLAGFAANPALLQYKDEFEKIRALAAKNKGKFKDNIICPCCGEKQEVELPEEILEYKYLLENQELCKRVGLVYLNDFIENYKQNLSEHFYSFIPDLNKVDNPDCLILVEGASEEASIPILGFRKRFILSHHKIQVYNSGSKEKLEADFFSIKANYPNRKVICLLDADAKKEKENLERVINEHKDKYRIVYINKGTFEDIFDVETSVEILNEMYPEGDAVTSADFDKSKDFLANINKVLYYKKKAKFDKVLFAKTISLRMDIEKLPKEISEILSVAEDFTKQRKFVKQ